MTLRARRTLAHGALVCASLSLLFCWVFARPLAGGRYPSESDLDAYYLPTFLAPPTVWSSFEFAGTPAFADPETSTVYPVHVLFARVIGSWTGFLLCGFVIAGCCMYAYAHAHTGSIRAASVASVAFPLSEALFERLPHPTIVHSVAWLPLILLSIDRLYTGRHRWTWVVIGACAAAMCVTAGHPQLPVYCAYLAGAYLLVGAIAERRLAAGLGAGAAMAGLAALLAGATVWPLIDVSRYTVRQVVTYPDFVSYANSWPQMLSAVFPTIEHPGLEAPTYVGIPVLMLASLGLCRLRTNWRAGFWLGVIVIVLILGTGSTLLSRAAFALPLYDRFRIVSRHLIFLAPAVATLAAFGVAAIEHGRIRRTAAVVSMLSFAVIVVGAALVLKWQPHLFQFDSDRGSWLPVWNVGVWAQLALAAASMLILAVALRAPRSRVWPAALVGLVIVDLLHAQPHPVGPLGVAMETIPASALRPSVHAELLRRGLAAAHQRLLAPNGTRPNDVVNGPWARVWRLPLVGGYSSVSLQSVMTLAGLASGGRVDEAVLSPSDAGLDVLAVRYVVVDPSTLRDGERAQLEGSPRWRFVRRFATSRTSDRGGDEPGPGESEYAVFENERALPGAWLAHEVLPVTDGQMEHAIRLSTLPGGRRFIPADVALVDDGRLPPETYSSGGDARVEDIGDGVARVRVSSRAGGFLVLSEAYHPDWQVQIDGQKPVPVVRTDAALQGTAVPAGDHVVLFRFVPAARRVGWLLTVLGTVIAAVVFAAALRQHSAARTHRVAPI